MKMMNPKDWTRKARVQISQLPTQVVFGALLGVVGLSGYLIGFGIHHEDGVMPRAMVERLESDLTAQRFALTETRALAEQNRRITSRKLAELSAQMLRLDAAGERMIKTANLDPSEFSFGQAPAVGGPDLDDSMFYETEQSNDPLIQSIDHMQQQLAERDRQLRVLDDLLSASQLARVSGFEGMPIIGGYISSIFGSRTDPFTGRHVQHKGIDFAGPVGSDVMTVSDGVVVFSGERSGFGRLVAIDHGDGFITRYGHNQAILVPTGRRVMRGERIALLGSSGRSTGPHVHFEVLRNGQNIDPADYLKKMPL